MNRYLLFAVFVLGCAATAVRSQDKTPMFTTSSSHLPVATFEPSHTFVLTDCGGPAGLCKQATIEFGYGTVTYSGDLPVDAAAKVFFDAVGKHYKDCK